MQIDLALLNDTLTQFKIFVDKRPNEYIEIDRLNQYIQSLPLGNQLTFLQLFDTNQILDFDDLKDQQVTKIEDHDLADQYLYDQADVDNDRTASPYTYDQLYQTFENTDLALGES